MLWLAIALGGGIGSMARHYVNMALAPRGLTLGFPIATFTVNLVGCFVLGALAGLLASSRLEMTEVTRAFVFVGILGGFTTFSTFGLDTITLARGGQATFALVNVLGQTVLGLAAVWIGFAAAHWRS